MTRILMLCPSTDGRGEAAQEIVDRELAGSPVGSDCQVDAKASRIAPRWWDNDRDLLIADLALYEAGLDAERGAYDAVCIETMSDSGVDALRARHTIPVMGPGRTCYLVALMLGHNFSILTLWDRWKILYEKRLREYGLLSHCASIRSIDMEEHQFDFSNMFGGREEQFFPLLEAQARMCVEADGAESIILGSTTMYQAHEFLADALDVPVLNPAAVTVKMTEALVGLGLTHYRDASTSMPTDDEADVVRRMVDAAAQTVSQPTKPEST